MRRIVLMGVSAAVLGMGMSSAAIASNQSDDSAGCYRAAHQAFMYCINNGIDIQNGDPDFCNAQYRRNIRACAEDGSTPLEM